ncbi:MAG: SGNH/GDSL hydrolase family protein [Cephaloticoccus sp.]|nr:SGNH/GDSL hydrolase family protein [Cephaloticoccus sp.]MCF7759637.1 SGNH/GDSL hydrolase family protein [Cephaloticoccus sp.]
MSPLPKVYVLGDSISIHYGPFLQQHLRGVMDYARKVGEDEARLNLDEPAGANGGDSMRILTFLEAKSRAGGIDADVILVNCGLHDIRTNPQTGAKQITPEHYAENLRAIIATVATMPPKLVWIRSTAFDEAVHNSRGVGFHRHLTDLEAYNAIADAIMRGAEVPVIDLHGFTLNLGPDLYCDHAHFHESIREKQAAYIAGWLQAYTQQNHKPC